ncbi:MAG TPA: RDD family protein [Polyangia bacterium]|nr:RDD family protein [Polyangia bacterium]
MSDPNVNPFTPPTATIDGPPAAGVAGVLAERGQRFLAALLDGLCAMPAGIFFVLFAFAAKGGGSDIPPLAFVWVALGVLYVLGLLGIQLYMLSTRGQTLGKRWMAIKIVKLDGSAPGFVHAALLRAIVNGLIGAIPYVGGIYSLVDVLMIFREDRRCLHDQIAGTRVIKVT